MGRIVGSIGKREKLMNMKRNEQWDKQLWAKFPTFDPNWTDDVKRAWYAAYDRLVEYVIAKPSKKAKTSNGSGNIGTSEGLR